MPSAGHGGFAPTAARTRRSGRRAATTAPGARTNRSEHVRGLPVYPPSFTVIERATGDGPRLLRQLGGRRHRVVFCAPVAGTMSTCSLTSRRCRPVSICSLPVRRRPAARAAPIPLPRWRMRRPAGPQSGSGSSSGTHRSVIRRVATASDGVCAVQLHARAFRKPSRRCRATIPRTAAGTLRRTSRAVPRAGARHVARRRACRTRSPAGGRSWVNISTPAFQYQRCAGISSVRWNDSVSIRPVGASRVAAHLSSRSRQGLTSGHAPTSRMPRRPVSVRMSRSGHPRRCHSRASAEPDILPQHFRRPLGPVRRRVFEPGSRGPLRRASAPGAGREVPGSGGFPTD